jgi:hypothetical protein
MLLLVAEELEFNELAGSDPEEFDELAAVMLSAVAMTMSLHLDKKLAVLEDTAKNCLSSKDSQKYL